MEKSLYSLDETLANRLAELFTTISDPTRVRIITALQGGEVNVGSLSEVVGISQSAASHQLCTLCSPQCRL